MADIELVIKIAEESYKEIKKIVADRNDHHFLENIIANGIPLPKGHWREVESEDMCIVGYYCSCCDLPMETDEKTAYCPHCGARMEGEE